MTGGGFGQCGSGRAGRGGGTGQQQGYGAGQGRAAGGRGWRRWLDFGFLGRGRRRNPRSGNSGY